MCAAVTLVLSAAAVLGIGALRETGETPKEPLLAEEIAPAEAKEMLVQFLETSEFTKRYAFVRESLPRVKRDAMTAIPDRQYYECGGWTIYPKMRRAYLWSFVPLPAYVLEFEFSTTDGKWNVTKSEVFEIHIR